MKTRKLVFNGNPSEREMFPFIYAGFLNGGNSSNAKPIDIIRREVRILDKLDAISEEHETGERILKPGEQTVLLEQPEYELLNKYFQNTPWTTKAARQVVAIVDWLAAIPLEENGG